MSDPGAAEVPVGYSSNDALLLGGIAVLLLILLAEFCDFGNVWQRPRPRPPVKRRRKPLTPCIEADSDKFVYGYEDDNGPTVWKYKYPDSLGCRQSPINIPCKNALVCPIAPLNWSCEYTVVPNRLIMNNNGNCVTLLARFPGPRPTISGGPLKTNYELFSIRFRWGPTDDEGSEHAIDYRRFAMEMQAVHVRNGFICRTADSGSSADNESIVIICYVFQVTTIDNPYLDPIICKLDNIKYPCHTIMIPPFPICWLMPTFVSDYYMYQGSLTYPPCTEGIHWIVQPEPLAISPRQVRKFRKLRSSEDGKILSNTRPIQCLNSREIIYYTNNDDCKI